MRARARGGPRTEAQDAVLAAIHALWEERPRKPTIAEIAARAGCATSTAHNALERLHRDGLLLADRRTPSDRCPTCGRPR